MQLRDSLVAMVVLCCVTSQVAATDIIAFDFYATVDSVRDDGGRLGGSIAAGNTLTGTFQFDLDATDTNPGDPTSGNYFPGAAPNSSLNVTNGSFTYSEDDFFVGVNDNFGGFDQFVIETGSGVSSPPVPSFEALLILFDDQQSAFSSDALPTAFGNLSQYEQTIFAINNSDAIGDTSISATITRILRVPEPNGLALAFFGALGTSLWRRPIRSTS